MIDSTVSGNFGGVGGGVSVNNDGGGTVELFNSTIINNVTDTDSNGGGLFINAGSVLLGNMIIAKNRSNAPNDDVFGNVRGDSFNNLIGVDIGLSGIANEDLQRNQIGTSASPIDPMLELLAGFTPMFRPLAGSPVIDKGEDALPGIVNRSSFDQAGNPRFIDGNRDASALVDIGAVEFQTVPVAKDDAVTTNRNTPIGINVLQNDEVFAATMVPSTVFVTVEPEHGDASVNPSTGEITYVPDPGYIGSDSFAYVFQDNFETVSNPATVTLQVAPITISTRVNGQDADSPRGPNLLAGNTATFTYIVTNNLAVPISNVVVRDDNGTPADLIDDLSPAFVGGDVNGNSRLDPGEVWEYSRTRNVTVGQYTNTGRVSAETSPADPVADSNPSNHFGLPSQLRVASASVAEGNSGLKPILFEVTISQAVAQQVFVAFATSDGGARVDNNDYLANSGVVTFEPGETQKFVTVQVIGDAVVENDETFSLEVSYSDFPLTDTAFGTIANDDSVVSTPPSVESIVRLTPAQAITSAGEVTFEVLFSEPVSGVDPTDFAIARTGTVGSTLLHVAAISPSTYFVTVSGITGNGTLGLNLVDDDTIRDSELDALGGNGPANGNFVGQAYTLDNLGPSVLSINRTNPSGSETTATQLIFTVTFSEPVSGVDSSDFNVVGTTTGNGFWLI